jgi:phosphoglycolate phosphatase
MFRNLNYFRVKARNICCRSQQIDLSRTKLVIFDKDGTLINHGKIFIPWTQEIISNFKDLIPDPVKLERHLGYHNGTFKHDSIVLHDTILNIQTSIMKFLNKEMNHNLNLEHEIKQRWVSTQINPNQLETFTDLNFLFSFLKEHDIKIAVCTADNRKSTIETLEILGVSKYIDDIVCGDDPVKPKPSKEPIIRICNNLQIIPENTIMIGDTWADIRSGQEATCYKSIGVLSGYSKYSDLKHADFILDSIDMIPLSCVPGKV